MSLSPNQYDCHQIIVTVPSSLPHVTVTRVDHLSADLTIGKQPTVFRFDECDMGEGSGEWIETETDRDRDRYRYRDRDRDRDRQRQRQTETKDTDSEQELTCCSPSHVT